MLVFEDITPNWDSVFLEMDIAWFLAIVGEEGAICVALIGNTNENEELHVEFEGKRKLTHYLHYAV